MMNIQKSTVKDKVMAKKLSYTFDSEDMATVMNFKLKMPIADIKTEKEYASNMNLIDEMFSAKSIITCKKAKGLLSDIIKATAKVIDIYESKKFPIKKSSPSLTLKSFMDDFNLKQKDLSIYFGSQSIVSDVLRGKRNISIEAAKKLGKQFAVSPTLFLEL